MFHLFVSPLARIELPLSSWLGATLSAVISTLTFLVALVFISIILKERRSPGSTLAWTLFILLFPLVGVPLYLLIGGRKLKRIAARKRALFSPVSVTDSPHGASDIERVLRASGAPPPLAGNSISVLGSGQAAYEGLLELIEGAKSFIHVTVYILGRVGDVGRDEVARDIVARLRRKAESGVQVKLLLDGIGSRLVSFRGIRALERAGGEVKLFLPLLDMSFRGPSTLRNHRKLIIADGTRAIVGGMNLAREYMGPAPDPKRWRDLELRVDGPAAGLMDHIFRQDWRFASGVEPAERGPEPVSGSGGTRVQVVASGPDVAGDPLYDAILAGIFAARHRVWVATPYFFPDETFTRALALAARRGVDVRILVPKRSDHVTLDVGRASYLHEVQDSGAAVYLFGPRMMHGKALVFDDDCALVGSANFDMRSLLLNYEIGAFVYGPERVREIAAWIESLFASSTVGLKEPGYFRDLLEGVGRVLGPML